MASFASALFVGCGSDNGGGICESRSTPPAVFSHVIWIWMENKSYVEIVGSPNATYINGLVRSCGVASNYHNLSHMSLANYVGSVTGNSVTSLLTMALLDCSPGPSCTTASKSLFSQVPSWKAYEESMETNCDPSGLVGYAVRHNPPPYLTTLTGCSEFDVPYPELQRDLDEDQLPAFSFITPNTMNDMHDGPVDIATMNGDAWLQAELPKILASKAYRDGGTVIFLTFDEGDGGNSGEDCTMVPPLYFGFPYPADEQSCHVATVVISPYTPEGSESDEFYTHYSLLRTTEELLGITEFLGGANGATSMRHAFNLGPRETPPSATATAFLMNTATATPLPPTPTVTGIPTGTTSATMTPGIPATPTGIPTGTAAANADDALRADRTQVTAAGCSHLVGGAQRARELGMEGYSSVGRRLALTAGCDTAYPTDSAVTGMPAGFIGSPVAVGPARCAFSFESSGICRAADATRGDSLSRVG